MDWKELKEKLKAISFNEPLVKLTNGEIKPIKKGLKGDDIEVIVDAESIKDELLTELFGLGDKKKNISADDYKTIITLAKLVHANFQSPQKKQIQNDVGITFSINKTGRKPSKSTAKKTK